jgi:amino acid permease
MIAVSAYVKTIFGIVTLLAWCGAMWANIRVAKQLRAAGYSIWTSNSKARFNAWKGTNILLFLSCAAVFAASLLALFWMQKGRLN